ncbi:MAG: DUF4876 domain-containing protein [Bacteroidales bacterium]|nr:DUF4876 domain-containing protein [Bacteroidales bacterium]
MKNEKYLILGLAVALCACEGDRPDSIDFIQIDGKDTADIELPVEGGEASFSISATGYWTIADDGQSWYTYSPQNGGEGDAVITVSAEEFDVFSSASASRIGFLTFSCGSYTKKVAVIQSGAGASVEPTDQTVAVRAYGGEISVEVPSGVAYTVSIPTAAQSWVSCTARESGLMTLWFEQNQTSDYRTAEIIVNSTSGQEIASVTVKQSWRNIEPSEMLIEEIYFTGTPLPSTGVPNGKNKDQYFLLTNNTDETLYADRLLIIESKNANAGKTWKEFLDPIIDDYCEAGAVMCIPGTGQDVPVLPGESLIIASNAINYREGYTQGNSDFMIEINPDGIDLSQADFEWYTQSTNSTIDIDIPEVPNVEMWYCYSLSIFILHDRGFQSYAIATPPAEVTQESFLADYSWENADYISHSLAGDFEMTLTDAYKVPNSWVIDAVMCTVPSINQTRQFSTTLDAGYTYASPQNIDADSQRYGLSVRRRTDPSTGRLIDTNNSTNDFTPNSIPSLK